MIKETALRPYFALTGFLVMSWLTIVALLIAYRAPYMDEGYYGMGTYNYLRHGQMDARHIEPSAYIFPANDKPNTRVDTRAYFPAPLEMIVQTGWESVRGWGLTQQRLFSALVAVLGVFLWF